ncbi:hypothetical protein FKW77_008995 [Venturia effusa]|uniref:Uncharacterized protein n=1 Tax=Venturia effusa TaxID=50376 RepID=A0A517LEF6_9PEZI|nr:hypothetical protein FKW77_008995 [Venturia effusa]
MRKSFVAISLTLMVTRAVAIPIAPVAGHSQGTSNDLEFGATTSSDREEGPAVDIVPVVSRQDRPPNQWSPSPSSGGWGEEPARGWGAPKLPATQAASPWSGLSGARPLGPTTSQPGAWGSGGYSDGAPSAGQRQGPSSGLFGNWPASSSSTSGSGGGGGLFGSRPDAATQKSSPGWTGGWGGSAPKSTGSEQAGWGGSGNAPTNPAPASAGSSWTSPFSGGSRGPPPSSGNTWGQSAAPASANTPSWGQPQPSPNIGPSYWPSGPSSSQPNTGSSWSSAPQPPSRAGNQGQGNQGQRNGNGSGSGNQAKPPIPNTPANLPQPLRQPPTQQQPQSSRLPPAQSLPQPQSQTGAPAQYPPPRDDGWRGTVQPGGPF